MNFKDLSGTLDNLEDIILKSKQLFVPMIASELLSDSSYYIPKEQGDLERSGIEYSDFDKGLLIWNVPYARRLYYNPQFNFSKDANPNARGLWAEYAKNQNKKKYKRLMKQGFHKAKE